MTDLPAVFIHPPSHAPIHNMNRILWACLTIIALGFGPVSAADSDAPTFTVQVPGADNLTVRVPPGWKHTMDRPPAGVPPLIDFTTPGGSLLKITFMPDAKGQFTKADELDKLVTKANQQYVANSVEKRVVLQRLASSAGPGVFSVFTDPKLVGTAKPPAGDYRHFSSGARSLGREVLIFSLLSNTKDNDEYRQVLEFVTSGVTVVAREN
jgi:hypothetical protein